MKEIVDALNKLANKANSEANALNAKKDKASTDAANLLFAKQAKIATLIQNLQQAQALILSNAKGAPSVKAIFDDYISGLKQALAPVSAMAYTDKKLAEALNSPLTTRLIDLADNNVKAIKRNLELRLMAAKAVEEKGTEEDLAAYKKRCQEDDALRQTIKDAQQFYMQLDNANLQWAEFLKQRFGNKDLPENKEPVKAPPVQQKADTAFIKDFFKGAIKAVGGLFGDFAKTGFKDTKAPLMKFLGNIVPLVLGFFANLLKPLFGKDFGDIQSSIADLSKGASSFVGSLADEDSDDKDLDLDLTEEDASLSGEPVLPAFARHTAASAKPSTTTTSSVRPDEGLVEQIASAITARR